MNECIVVLGCPGSGKSTFDRVNRRHIEEGRCAHGRGVALVVLRRDASVEAFLNTLVSAAET